MCACTCTHAHVYTRTCTHSYVSHARTHARISLSLYMCVRTHMLYIHVYMHVCTSYISLRFSPLSIIQTEILHSATPRLVSSFLSSFVYRLACMVLVLASIIARKCHTPFMSIVAVRTCIHHGYIHLHMHLNPYARRFIYPPCAPNIGTVQFMHSKVIFVTAR